MNQVMLFTSKAHILTWRALHWRAEHRWAVPQSALIGKAFFIYWPHGIPFLNDGKGIPTWYHRTDHEQTNYPSFSVPFYPQVWRMRRIG